MRSASPSAWMPSCWPANATRAGGSDLEEEPYPQRPRLLAALAAAQAVVTHEIAERAQQQGVSGPRIGEMIHQARVDAVTQSLA